MTPAYHYIKSQAEEYLTDRLQTKKASSFMMLEILTYFVHKIVLIKKTVFLDVILTSRYETGG